jgi:hypothetical protein
MIFEPKDENQLLYLQATPFSVTKYIVHYI